VSGFGSPSNGNFRVLENACWVQMPDSQFGDWLGPPDVDSDGTRADWALYRGPSPSANPSIFGSNLFDRLVGRTSATRYSCCRSQSGASGGYCWGRVARPKLRTTHNENLMDSPFSSRIENWLSCEYHLAGGEHRPKKKGLTQVGKPHGVMFTTGGTVLWGEQCGSPFA